MFGEGAAGAVFIGRRVGRRSGSLCARRGVAGSSAHAASTVLELDAAAAGLGVAAGSVEPLLRHRDCQILLRQFGRRSFFSPAGFIGGCSVDRGLDRLSAVAREPSLVRPGLLRLGNARLAGPLRGIAVGLRRGQLAGGRLPADHRRLGAVVSVRFVWFITPLSLLSYSVLVIDFYYGPNAQGNVRRFRPSRNLRVGPAGDGPVVAYLVQRV